MTDEKPKQTVEEVLKSQNFGEPWPEIPKPSSTHVQECFDKQKFPIKELDKPEKP